MPSHTLTYHIAVIGPSDTENDVEAVRTAINELTREFTLQEVTLSFHHWKELPPGLSTSGQKYIDENISWGEMDFVVGLLWQRFGTPVEGALSGTEHEYREIYRRFSSRKQPDLLFYFKDPTPNADDMQREQINAFKRDIQAKALTGKYTSTDDLEKRVRDDLRSKITKKLLSQNQTQKRIGQLPPNRRITVELLIFAEFPSEETILPTIVLLKNFHGEEFVFDTRTMYPQELANWIAKSMGFTFTPGKTLRAYLEECNQRNYKAVSDNPEDQKSLSSHTKGQKQPPEKNDPFGLFQANTPKEIENSPLVITQFWLGSILYADHPALRLKELKIALGSYITKQKLIEDAAKHGGRGTFSLPRPQIQNDTGGKKLIL